MTDEIVTFKLVRVATGALVVSHSMNIRFLDEDPSLWSDAFWYEACRLAVTAGGLGDRDQYAITWRSSAPVILREDPAVPIERRLRDTPPQDWPSYKSIVLTEIAEAIEVGTPNLIHAMWLRNIANDLDRRSVGHEIFNRRRDNDVR